MNARVSSVLSRRGLSTAGAWIVLAGVCSADVATSSTFNGNVGVEVAAYPDVGGGSTTGNFTLSTIPAGATILQATLYSSNYFGAVTPDAIFDGNALGTTSTFDNGDSGFAVQKWDVTAFVSGNGVYAVSATGFTQSYGLALVVVFSDGSLPSGRVVINDGADDLCCPDTETTSIDGLAGAGTLWVHTAADNNGGIGESGEEIRFNGSVVGGPIDANLGNYASLFALPVTVLAGANSAEIFSPQDFFGWDLAVLHVAGGLGSKYCTANANSTGSPADLSASGSASSGAGDLTLTSAPVPNQNSIFVHGMNQSQTPFGNGFMCTTGDITRGAVVLAAGNTATYTYDNSDAKHSLAAFIGMTRNFQHWFRDPMGGGALFNTSNAMSITIQP